MLKINKIMASGLSAVSADAIASFVFEDNIVAAGFTQATAKELSADINMVTDVPLGAGVILPAAAAGDVFYICNAGSNPLTVFPPLGASINGRAVNSSFELPVYGGPVDPIGNSTALIFASPTKIILG